MESQELASRGEQSGPQARGWEAGCFTVEAIGLSLSCCKVAIEGNNRLYGWQDEEVMF